MQRRVGSADEKHTDYAHNLNPTMELGYWKWALETAQEVLHDLLRANDRRVTIDEIQKRVAEHYNIRLADRYLRTQSCSGYIH